MPWWNFMFQFFIFWNTQKIIYITSQKHELTHTIHNTVAQNRVLCTCLTVLAEGDKWSKKWEETSKNFAGVSGLPWQGKEILHQDAFGHLS